MNILRAPVSLLEIAHLHKLYLFSFLLCKPEKQIKTKHKLANHSATLGLPFQERADRPSSQLISSAMLWYSQGG